MRSFSLVAAAAVIATCLPELRAQRELWHRDGSDRAEMFGASVVFLGDVNGDSVPDFAVGAPAANPLPSPHEGRVRIFSGADGSLIRELRAGSDVSFGSAIADARDVDGDGVDDLLVGAPSDGNGDGAAFILSPTTGAVLLVLRDSVPKSAFGSAVAGLGDVTGDGVPDVAIGAQNHLVNGLVEICSGADGSVVSQWLGSSSHGQFGARNSVADAGDLDADGVHDLAVTERIGISSLLVNLKVYSGSTRTPLLITTFASSRGGSFVSSSVSSAGDVDADGHDDVLVAGLTDILFGLYGEAAIYSGATGAMLLSLSNSDGGFGASCGAAGDVDHDGHGDVAISRLVPTSGGVALVFSGTTGAELFEFNGRGFAFGTSLAGPTDLDGDGYPELLIGAPLFDPTASGGEIQIRSLKKGKILEEVAGENALDFVRGGITFFDDVDGDGRADFLAGISQRSSEVDTIVCLSGADGHELRRFDRGAQDFGGTLVVLPDVNADGVSDFAVASATTVSSVEVRSGADGALIQTFTDARTGIAFGATLAAGIQPTTGAVQLAIGSPLSDAAKTDAGEIRVFDVASGAFVIQAFGNFAGEQFGASIAYLGDINKDKIGDWAVGAPLNGKTAKNAGRAAIVSGKTGSQLKAFLGAAADDQLGRGLSALDDLNGDGIGDLLIGAPGAGSNDEGQLQIIAGNTWLVLATIAGAQPAAEIGGVIAAVHDANGDGAEDLLAAWPSRKRVDLFSSATATLVDPTFTGSYGRTLATAPAWLAGLQGGADGPMFAIADRDDATGGPATGRIAVHELDDFYLFITPSSAPPGTTVTALARGGPAGAQTGLYLESLNGVPVGQFLEFGLLGSTGAWSTSGVIPPGLSGTTLTLRQYAIGFNGKLVDSQPQELFLE